MVVNRVFQRGHHLCTSQFHFNQHIRKRKQGKRRVHAQGARSDWYAYPASILQRKVSAFGGKQKCLCHHLRGIATSSLCIGRFTSRRATATVGAFARNTHQTKGFGCGTDGLGLFQRNLV